MERKRVLVYFAIKSLKKIKIYFSLNYRVALIRQEFKAQKGFKLR